MRLGYTPIGVMGVLVVAAGQSADVRAGSIVNGSFEVGLAGWDVSPSTLVSVQVQVNKLGTLDPWKATDGTFFAYLSAGAGVGVYTMVSQPFAAGAGDTLKFDVFFDTRDSLPYDDNGYARLVGVTGTSELYARSVGDGGTDGWTHVTHAFTAAGTYVLEFGVTNVGDEEFPSALGVDAVRIWAAAPVAVPVPAAWVGAVPLLGVVAWAGRRRRGGAGG